MRYLYHYSILSGKAIQRWLKSLFGLRLPLLLCLLVSIGMVSSCSKIPLGLLGGGTNVAANTQVGKTNNQTVGTTKNTEQDITVTKLDGTVKQSNDENKVNTDIVENLNINETNMWIILLLILGWLMPSPHEIWNGFLRLIRTIRGKE